MLVLSRRRDEVIRIGKSIKIMVVDVQGGKVSIGVDAPKETPVHRAEVYDAIQAEGRDVTLAKDASRDPADNAHDIETLRAALEQSLKLQTHYAELLNMHDGGRRFGFPSAEAWIDRLREIGKLDAKKSGAAS